MRVRGGTEYVRMHCRAYLQRSSQYAFGGATLANPSANGRSSTSSCRASVMPCRGRAGTVLLGDDATIAAHGQQPRMAAVAQRAAERDLLRSFDQHDDLPAKSTVEARAIASQRVTRPRSSTPHCGRNFGA